MNDINLKNKPLIEAIFEFRWELVEKPKGIFIDPYYKIIIGQIFEKLSKDYPHYNPLPSSSMPDEIAPYVVQYQFRKAENDWPVIQLGPGVITLNETNKYTWTDFYKRIEQMLNVFYEVYPKATENIKPSSILLRYIDAVDFDHSKENLLIFLKDKLKTNITISDNLFKDTDISNMPAELDLKFAFKSLKPKGVTRLRFSQGQKSGNNALIWEIQIIASKDDLPGSKSSILIWADEAHNLTHDWFFKMIEGELLERFK